LLEDFGDTLTHMLRRVVCLIAPKQAYRFSLWHYRWQRNRQLSAEAKALRRRMSAIQDLDMMAELVLQSKSFRPSQQKAEIVALLGLLRELQPECVREIGSYRGGTLALFCQVVAPNARILAIDLNFKPEQIKVLRHFAHRGQRITFFKGDSHAPETRERVKRWLGVHQLDFLFIDGDHSLDGVTRDFEMYAPLTRAGGVIAFHDIVPDYRARYGTKTQSFTGEVPQFWARLKQKWPGAQEFVADPEQDGFGIGVLHWDNTPHDRRS